MSDDFRHALRALARNRAFTATSVLLVALGIGATTTAFNLIDAVLLRSLPVHAPEELFAVEALDSANTPRMFSYPLFRELADQTKVFSGIFAWSAPILRVGKGPEVERVAGMLVTGGFSSTLALTSSTGRWFSNSDDHAGAPAVVVLSYRLALRHFGNVESALGRTVDVEGGCEESSHSASCSRLSRW